MISINLPSLGALGKGGSPVPEPEITSGHHNHGPRAATLLVNAERSHAVAQQFVFGPAKINAIVKIAGTSVKDWFQMVSFTLNRAERPLGGKPDAAKCASSFLALNRRLFCRFTEFVGSRHCRSSMCCPLTLLNECDLVQTCRIF